jgi:hypothetical protein
MGLVVDIPPEIALVDNTSGGLSDPTLDDVAEALTVQIRDYFGPIWLNPWQQSPEVVVALQQELNDTDWFIELVDSLGAAEQDAGFHRARVVIDARGVPMLVPWARVGIAEANKIAQSLDKRFSLTQDDMKGIWSVAVSHELLEMLADPLGNYYSDPLPPPDGLPGAPSLRRVVYLLEVCDPCPTSVYVINGVKVADFVRPDYFHVNFSQGDPDVKPISPEEPLGIVTFRLFDAKDEPLWCRYYSGEEYWPLKKATLETSKVPAKHLKSLVKPAFDGTDHPSAA